ncbi:MAG: hypothetical protein GEV11_16725 [Streptosporangiales bacterium]|nr:hypothetical protein [Streptosporangiales bacterium]
MDLPTYTNIWRIEKRLYKLYDFRLPMPLPMVQVGVFVGIFLPWIVLMRLVGLEFAPPFGHVIYLVPPGVLTFLATRPVIEGKRLTELLISQSRYLAEPRVWCRLSPAREPDEIVVAARVWRRAPESAPALAVEAPVARPATARDAAASAVGAPVAGVPAPGVAPGAPASGMAGANISAAEAGVAGLDDGARPAEVAAGAGRGDAGRPAKSGKAARKAAKAAEQAERAKRARARKAAKTARARKEEQERVREQAGSVVRPVKPGATTGGPPGEARRLRPSERRADRADRAPEQGPDRAAERAAEQAPERAAGPAPERGVERSAERPADRGADRRTGSPAGRPAAAAGAGHDAARKGLPPVTRTGEHAPDRGISHGTGPATPVAPSSASWQPRRELAERRIAAAPNLELDHGTSELRSLRRAVYRGGDGRPPGRETEPPPEASQNPEPESASTPEGREATTPVGPSTGPAERRTPGPRIGTPFQDETPFQDDPARRTESAPSDQTPPEDRERHASAGEGAEAGRAEPDVAPAEEQAGAGGRPPRPRLEVVATESTGASPTAIPGDRRPRAVPRPVDQPGERTAGSPERHRVRGVDDTGARGRDDARPGAAVPGEASSPREARDEARGARDETWGAARDEARSAARDERERVEEIAREDVPAAREEAAGRGEQVAGRGERADQRAAKAKGSRAPAHGRPEPVRPPAPPTGGGEPVTRGWRRLARAVSSGGAGAGGGKHSADPGQVARITVPLAEPGHVVVLGCTGGAGQTVTALMLGHTVATYRDDRVLAVDVNPGSGSLTRRTRADTPETLTSLLANADEIGGYLGMRGYTSQSRSRLEVLASLDDPYVQTLDDADYARLLRVIDRFYKITLFDPAASGVARVLPHADQVVLVAPASADAPRAVAMTFEWLDGHGYGELRSRSVVVVNGVSKRSLSDVERAESVARGRCRAIVRVPWDDHLGHSRGAPSEPRSLRVPARRAYMALAGMVTSGFTTGNAPAGIETGEPNEHQEVSR